MIRTILVFLILLCPAMTQAAESMQAQLVRVVDGDTIVVNISGWPEIIGKEIGIRVAGCDTPELKDKRPEMRQKAYEAKDTAKLLLGNARVIELRNISRGKYFRLVADVYADGVNLSTFLIESGLAMPYDGGRKPW